MVQVMQSSGLRRREKMRLAIKAAFQMLKRHRLMARFVFLKMGSLGQPFDAKLMEIHGRIARLIERELEQARKEGGTRVANPELVFRKGGSGGILPRSAKQIPPQSPFFKVFQRGTLMISAAPRNYREGRPGAI